jgi:hypothetical protein
VNTLRQQNEIELSGIKLVLTCSGFPEQYDAYARDGKLVAYLRMRHGSFYVTCPHLGGECVYSADLEHEGGIFTDSERALHLSEAAESIRRWCEHHVGMR